MIIVIKPRTAQTEIEKLTDKIEKAGLTPHVTQGVERTVINILGDLRNLHPENEFASFSFVETIIRIQKPYKLASKEHAALRTVIDMGPVSFKDENFVMIAGPCALESEEQIFETARLLKESNIRILRASAFKPRTSPYDYQGMGYEGLKMLKRVREKTGLLVETEVTDIRDLEPAAEYVDIVRIGSRNMHNFEMLKEAGKIDRPIILKRGFAATIKEFLMAAEYILSKGNRKVILCERGIRTFETTYRNTLDISAVLYLKTETHLPVIIDPSHAAGRRDLIPGMCKVALAAGADGLLIEMHPTPENAMSDGAQSLYPNQLAEIRANLVSLAPHFGKTVV